MRGPGVQRRVVRPNEWFSAISRRSERQRKGTMTRYTIRKSGPRRDPISAAPMSGFVEVNCFGRKTRSDVRTELIEGRRMRDRVIAPGNQKRGRKSGFEWLRKRVWGLVEAGEPRVGWKSSRMKAAGLAVDLYTNGMPARHVLRKKKREQPA